MGKPSHCERREETCPRLGPDSTLSVDPDVLCHDLALLLESHERRQLQHKGR